MSVGAFSIDQLMELAGLSVSQACMKTISIMAIISVHGKYSVSSASSQPWPQDPRCVWTRQQRFVARAATRRDFINIHAYMVIIGGDGLVAARHLHHYGYQPTIFYPKPTQKDIYDRLTTQLKNLNIPFTNDFTGTLSSTDHIIDAIFGFSFSGEVRDPFRSVIAALESTNVPVLAVDAPSSWNIEDGPPQEGPGAKFMPQCLISLTAPKPLVRHFQGTHFVGGRFLPASVAEKYDLDLPKYEGVDQIVEVRVEGQKL